MSDSMDKPTAGTRESSEEAFSWRLREAQYLSGALTPHLSVEGKAILGQRQGELLNGILQEVEIRKKLEALASAERRVAPGWFFEVASDHRNWWDGHPELVKWAEGRNVMHSEEAFLAGWKRHSAPAEQSLRAALEAKVKELRGCADAYSEVGKVYKLWLDWLEQLLGGAK